MTTRKAKITLGLDITGLKQSTAEAKKALEDLGKVPLDTELKKAFKKEILEDATQQAGLYKSMIQAATKELEGMATSGGRAWDHTRANKLVGAVREYRKQLEEVNRLQRTMQGGGGGSIPMNPTKPLPMPTPSGGGGGVASTLSGAGRMLSAIGLGVGVGAAINRASRQAEQSLQLRSLTGGETISSRSSLGFTREEQRGRGTDVARGLGRATSEADLTRATNLSEVLGRAFGIQGGQVGEAMGAARRGGVRDETKFVAGAIGDAVAVGMSGGAIGEYLSSMTSYLQEMATGTTIDEKSIRGFAGSLGQMDFFKKSPERIFDTMNTLGRTFSSGDQFQQFQSLKAFGEARGGAGVGDLSGFRIRQKIGMFGGGSGMDKLAKGFEEIGMPELAKTLKTSGKDIANKFLIGSLNDAVGGSASNQGAADVFQEITGLRGENGLQIFQTLMKQKQKGNVTGISDKEFDTLKDGAMSPEEQARKNMSNFDGSVKLFDERIDNLQNGISDFITKGVEEFVHAVDEFVGIKNDFVKLAGVLAAAGLIKGAAGGIGGGAGGAGGGIAGGLIGGALRSAELVAASATIGVIIGDKIRDKLNEWTDNEWDRSVQKFWMGVTEATGITNYGEQDRQGKAIRSQGSEWIQEARRSGRLKNKDVLSGKQLKQRSLLYDKIYQDKLERDPDANPPSASEIERMMTSAEKYQDDDSYLNRTHLKGKLHRDTSMDPDSLEIQALSDLIMGGDFEAGGFQFGGPIRMQGGGAVADFYKGAKGSFRSRKGDKKKKEKGMWSSIFGGDGPSTSFTKSIAKARGKQFGGPIDSVPAMLTPGEFVVNAASTHRNYNALVHANEGGLIQAVGGGGGGAGSDFGESPGIGENTGATNANTQAILQLADAIRSSRNSIPRGGNMRLGLS